MVVNGMWNVIFCVQCMKRVSMKFVYYYLIAIKLDLCSTATSLSIP